MIFVQDSNIEEYENSILQGLCADALISVSDDDSDLELTIDEFMKCLNPGWLKNTLF